MTYYCKTIAILLRNSAILLTYCSIEYCNSAIHQHYCYCFLQYSEKLLTVSLNFSFFSFQNIESMVVEVTQDTNKKPMVLIRVLKDHDLVLEFSYVAERKKFLSKLENFLQGQKKNLETVPCFRDHMLMNAETKVRFKNVFT